MPDVQESYQANTVIELRDELAARGLHTSGTKDELVARLEEDDIEAEAEETAEGELAPEAVEAEVPADPYKRVYSPWELPANPFAAQAFADANPDAVDSALQLPPEQQALANANIQDTVDQYAAVGVVVEDPRLGSGGGGNGGSAGPGVTAVNPTSGTNGTALTITGTGLSSTTNVSVNDFDCDSLNVVSDTEVTAVTPTGAHKGTYPVLVTVAGNVITGPNFQVT